MKDFSPKTLQETIQYFGDFEHCRAFMTALRWPDGKVRCPRCDSEKVDISPERPRVLVRANMPARSSRSRWARYRGFRYPAREVASRRLDARETTERRF